ncbi:MAG: carboxypeptidase regulatory-like domain-containing protein [Planctomycetaceae bacterium]|nr:carboxypeptidase regulatory-like domain-containing protein [Planctomycetaceae bacterium]
MFLLFFSTGCASKDPGPELTPVTGVVLLNDEPLVNADLIFIPLEGTPGVGGQARTKAAGEFKIIYSHGGEGLPVGTYRVAVSYRLMPDGSPVPEGDTTPPIESPARETLPRKYADSDQSELKATVAPGKPIELKLTAKK